MWKLALQRGKLLGLSLFVIIFILVFWSLLHAYELLKQSGKLLLPCGLALYLRIDKYLQKLWQKYKVDLAFYGHVHNYERSCPIYENVCVSKESDHYSGQFNATIHIAAGGGGASLALFSPFNTTWSYFKDFDFGFTKLTAFNRSSLLLEYKRSSDGFVYDKFWITRHYRDVLGCDKTKAFCPLITLGS